MPEPTPVSRTAFSVLYSAEISKKDAVERETLSFCSLSNIYDASAAKRDSIGTYDFTAASPELRVEFVWVLPFASTQTATCLHSVISLPEFFSFIVCWKVIVAPVVSGTHVSRKRISIMHKRAISTSARTIINSEPCFHQGLTEDPRAAMYSVLARSM